MAKSKSLSKHAKKAIETANKTVTKPVERPAEKPVEEKPATPTAPAASTATPATPAAPATPAVEQKPVEEKPQKPSQSKEQKQKPAQKPKVEEVEVEEVHQINIPSLKNPSGERIDANRAVDLMGMIERNYTNEKANTTPELKAAMKEQFDMMMYISLLRYNEQTKTDFGEAGVVLNNNVFAQLQATIGEQLGITMKALPSSNDGQMSIDFEASNKTAPTEVQEAIKEELKKAPITEVPTYNESMSEADVLNNIGAIMGMQGNGGMYANLHNSIVFARSAFKMQNDDPGKVLAVMLHKMEKLPPLMIGLENMTQGKLMVKGAPFFGHTTLYRNMKDYKYTEAQVANIVRSLISDRLYRNELAGGGTFAENAKVIHGLCNAFNDKFINELINSKEPVAIPKVEGLVKSKNETIDFEELSKILNETYGSLDNKKMKKKMQEIAALYFPEFETIEALSK